MYVYAQRKVSLSIDQDKLSRPMVRTKSGPTVEHPHWSFHPFGTIQQTILHRFQLWHEQETLTIETWPGTGSNQVTRGHQAFRSSVSFWYQPPVFRSAWTSWNTPVCQCPSTSPLPLTSLMAFHKHPKRKM